MTIEEKIWKAIKGSKNILISSHERIDGDGVGSELALSLMASEIGLEPTIINDGVVPEVYRFLPGADGIKAAPDGWRDDFDLAVALDSATLQRLRGVGEKIPEGMRIINIDHHVSNTGYGELNWVNDEASSTGEMLYDFAAANDIRITPEIAACLYTAIITDTGRFCYSNTRPKTHNVVAELIRRGASPSDISRRIYREERLNVLHLRRLATATLDFAEGGRIAWMDVTARMHRETGTDYLDTQDFVDIPKSIKGVGIGLLFREVAGDGRIRVSLRSEGAVDVNKVAAKFGGGGHKRAAGCSVEGTIEQAHEKVLAAVEEMLKEGGESEQR